jgi:hypothetical protein
MKRRFEVVEGTSSEGPVGKRASLFLSAKTRSDLGAYYETTLSAFEKYFSIQPWPEGDRNAALADEVGAALDDVRVSTDCDCRLYPCVIEGVGAEEEDFFRALGISPGEELQGQHDKYPRLVVAPKDETSSTTQLLSGLGEESFESIEEYFEEGDRKALAKAATMLDNVGDVTSVSLVTDNYCVSVAFTLARSSTGAYVGAFTILVET